MGVGRKIPHHTLIEVQLPIQSAQGKKENPLGIRQLQGEINHLATWKIYRTLMPS
jgi:hypothetical protein